MTSADHPSMTGDLPSGSAHLEYGGRRPERWNKAALTEPVSAGG